MHVHTHNHRQTGLQSDNNTILAVAAGNKEKQLLGS